MKHKAILVNWTTVFTIVVLLLGVYLRFSNLDRKIYWIDEVHTSLRASGYSRTEFVEQAPRGKIVSIEEIHKFQKLTPERNFVAGIKAISSSEHSPLYYGLARVGMEFFGSSINVTRGVAASLSLLLFPSIYWLAQELFNSRFISLTVTTLVAVSPLQIIYAQEAREYSLFAVTIALASAAFLRFINHKNNFSWQWYGLTITLGLYTQPLFVLVMMAHGIYLMVVNNFRWGKLLKQYFFATALGIFLFIPWILVFIFNDDGVGMWVERDLPLNFWLQRWFLNISSTFFDWQVVYQERFFDVEQVQDFTFSFNSVFSWLVIPIFGLIIYSTYYFVTHTSRHSSFFITVLMGVTAVALGFPDLIWGGQRSTVARYILAIPLGIQLIVGYCLAVNMSNLKYSHWHKQIWRLIFALTITLSLVCSWQMLQSPTWWNKYSSYYNAEVAKIINLTEKPLIISNAKRISRSTSLSYQLQDNAKFLLLDESDNLPSIPSEFSNIFLFRPFPDFLQKLQQNNLYTIEPVFIEGHLYKITYNK
ncbi:conserved membrane hypothetical protein [Hyella patelloides LEGE 07179]|uniref:Glycosyltransferase RgtA/B/C/D-like domain-containing protein n=1 Tax=Hyella patelloides LEGE 07179 TaxID=945734 RepID=A0A563VS75_9CYAN|nr:glycosyltransferase family 39 protein [Hyella patelloides]VEP14242.1 conserved membrane hypothetical protein [Hyella patelloides LEGE 07179]